MSRLSKVQRDDLPDVPPAYGAVPHRGVLAVLHREAAVITEAGVPTRQQDIVVIYPGE